MPNLPPKPRHRGHSVRHWLACFGLAFLSVLVVQSTARAQGVISGRVIDAEVGEPLAGAIVELVTGTGRVVATATTGANGTFQISQAPSGTYSLLVSTLGYETYRMERVSSQQEAVNVGDIPLVSRAFKLNPIVVTASRAQEKSLESPASVYTIPSDEIQERQASTPVEHVRGVPGVDVATTGLQQNNVVARGFNNVFSGALFVLTDNRWASVPSLRLNAYNLIPVTNQDIDRIEMVLGPGSALYGPNVDKGVMHIITRSPLDHQETVVSVAGGSRAGNNVGNAQNVWQGSLRHSGLFSDNVGYKISAMYFEGTDWKYVDPVEQTNRASAIQAGLPNADLIGARDFNASRLTADARIDFRLDDQSTLIFSGGMTNLISSIEMTGIGSAQADGWTYSYVQSRFRSGDLFAQVYANFSDAGDSYTLRDANLVNDNSLLFAGQLQHATNFGERQRFIYGADFIRTIPRTNGSIHGRNENDDNIAEAGGYVQSETELSPMFDLVLAGRLDYHDRVDDIVISPRAAIVFKPTPEQNFRVTYNRAFSQPTSINFSLDLQSSPTLGPFPDFGVRALGVPAQTGLTFRRDCNGGLCMRSPFAADPSAFLPLDVTPYWQNAIDGLATILVAQGSSLDPALEAFMRSLNPAGVGTVMRMFDAQALGFGSILSEDAAAFDVEPMKPSITNTFEVGYKGLIGDRLLLGVDAYYQQIEDFIGPLRFETPNAFMNPQGLAAFLEGPLLAAGVPPAQVPQLIGALANVPLGTVTWEQTPSSNPTDLFVTYRNFGDVDLWGADLGLTLLLTDELSFTGSYSYVSDNFFAGLGSAKVDSIGDIALNAPRNKGTLAGHYRNQRLGVAIELRGRYIDSYPVNSGVFVGRVPSFTLVDANINYTLPIATATQVSLTVNNIFDDEHQEMVGAPFVGRMAMLRVTQSF